LPGHTGPTGPYSIGPTGPATTFLGTNYSDTTTLSYVQNNGTPYFTVSSTASEMGTLINVLGVNITYLAIAYFYVGTPSGVNVQIQDFSGNVLAIVNLATTATDPTITTGTFIISTTAPRAVKIYINGTINDSNYINVRTILIGFN
jgi:hypothetical protein